LTRTSNAGGAHLHICLSGVCGKSNYCKIKTPKSKVHSGVEDQPQCPGLWHSGSPSARSFSRFPSPPPPLIQSPSPPRSLVRDGQTSPLRPRLVVSRSTCPPLSPFPHANGVVIGTAVTHTSVWYTHTGRYCSKHTLIKSQPNPRRRPPSGPHPPTMPSTQRSGRRLSPRR
jgi:hypothetical protein